MATTSERERLTERCREFFDAMDTREFDERDTERLAEFVTREIAAALPQRPDEGAAMCDASVFAGAVADEMGLDSEEERQPVVLAVLGAFAKVNAPAAAPPACPTCGLRPVIDCDCAAAALRAEAANGETK